MALITPAVLPSSREDLKEKLRLLTSISSVKRIQIDVVDGRFAAPASWPFSMPTELQNLEAFRDTLLRPDGIEYEIDLMCLDAEKIAAAWLSLGATRLIFHAEAITDLPQFLASVRKKFGGGDGLISFGLALNIASDLSLIEQNIDDIQFVQFMGIARIGRQGQPFDRRVFEKVRVFCHHHPEMPVQVDGGISLPSARQLLALGVCNLVIGSGILKAKDPAAALAAFEVLETPFGV